MKLPISHKISEEPLLIHGTNIFSIPILYERRSLPSSENEKHLSFAYTRLCSQTRGLKERGYRKSQAIATAKFYAEDQGRRIFLKRVLGLEAIPEQYDDLVPTKRNYQAVFREARTDLTREQASMLAERLFSLKGILVEPTEGIDGRTCYGDDFNELVFYFPRGLPLRYIRAIEPLGVLERRALRGDFEFLHYLHEP